MTQTNGYQNKYLNQNPNSTDKIRILIVDDSGVIREGLKVMLETKANFEIVGTADNGKSAIDLVKNYQPDLVIMDLEMPNLNGISSTQIICEKFSDTKVVIFSEHTENSYITQSLEAGAKGYFLKRTPIEEFVQGIENVHKGFCQFAPGLLENYISGTTELKAQNNDFNADLISKDSISSESEIINTELPEPNIPKSKPFRLGIFIGILAFAILALGLAIAKFRPDIYTQITEPPPPVTPIEPIPEPTAVSALGRIEPEGEVIELSVSEAAEGSKVEQLLVEKGDRVKQGQLVAVLDSYNRRQAALESAKADVQIAQANLDRVKAGAKQGDINAQKSAVNLLEVELRGQIAAQEAEIARLRAELNNAEVEYRRYQQLFQDGAISASERDTRRLRVDTFQQQLKQAQETLNKTIETTKVQSNEAEARLDSIAEVRPVDVQVAQAELEQAKAAVQQAYEAVALTEVRSPLNAQVLDVNVRPGEVVQNGGIISLGQTEQMYVVAEVYETEVEKIRLGQRTIVTGSAFTEELRGEVSQIGLEVKQQNVFESDPLVDTDNKVVEVKIKLFPESSQRVTALSNLQVQVIIFL
jgi:HlyD family secretion protein